MIFNLVILTAAAAAAATKIQILLALLEESRGGLHDLGMDGSIFLKAALVNSS